jgi:hypothetical protein
MAAGCQGRRERLTEQQIVVAQYKSHGLPNIDPQASLRPKRGNRSMLRRMVRSGF